MKDFISKYLWICVEVLFAIASLAMILYIYDNVDLVNSAAAYHLQQTIISENLLVDYEIPTINDTSFIVNGDILELNSEFNWKNYVSASDSQGSDLIGYVIMNGNVDTSIAGKYEVEFILNWNGESISKKVDFFVNE